ncbi:hypothetical protein HELRODRAFT_164209 [Helobdella robusta]|uniref:Endonuclease/exonuclease/phosphatase domain-containing protein n=1 Tax=Helobdella robusta TaxID=6412 RepID=T1EV36_HELRO|nr:hypothetical protein HELRODRAFT_164209 [Helobdella robusta]ESN94376.1 hypothetical protein HELRODRAFT_164209 [Helobdella robusta]
MALSIRQKRVRRISGDPVDGVVVQGPVDGLATGTPLYSVAVQGTIDGRTTCKPRGWRFGTWNVGTLTGRSLEVVEELQRRMVDVAALQEVRWKGEGTRFVGAKGGRYKLWWKGDDGTGGVGVMVREELLEQVLEVRRRSNGVIVVVMVFGKVIVRVISGYAPQQSRKEEEKDRRFRNAVLQCKSYPGTDCGSDHNQVVCKIRIKRIKSEVVPERLNFVLTEDINKSKYQIFRDAITESAIEVISVKEKRGQKWITDDIVSPMDERRKVKGCNPDSYKKLGKTRYVFRSSFVEVDRRQCPKRIRHEKEAVQS